MAVHELLAPHNALSAVPQRQDVKRGRVITHGSLASGGFGWVSSGVDAVTGKPLAIKEHRPKDARAQAKVVWELEVGQSFNVSTSFVACLMISPNNKNLGAAGITPHL